MGRYLQGREYIYIYGKLVEVDPSEKVSYRRARILQITLRWRLSGGTPLGCRSGHKFDMQELSR